ncbi:MAG TPA: DUF4397 domain-containing protein [Blastococcus sp.]|nr:DUF4397 domain-containing protein [Blastococcus sp.]
MRRLVRAAGVAVLVAAGPAIGGTAQAAPDADGLLRLAHLSPDTPAVDVYVDAVADPDAGITLEGVGYGAVSEYQDVPTGSYTVSMRQAGASPDTPPVLSTTVEVTGDTARTVAGVGLFADLGLTIIEDSLQTPPAQQSRVRVLAGASNAETLDVGIAGGPSVATGLAFASTSEYVDVPAGSTTLTVAAGGQAPAELPVELAAGSVYSLVVLDADQGLRVEPVLDAAGAGVAPAGGVETGAGGAAGTGPSAGLVVMAAGGAAAVLVAGSRVRRRPARHASRRP